MSCLCAAENCIVVAEGVLQHSGVFKVRALGFPPVELRSESRLAAKVRRQLFEIIACSACGCAKSLVLRVILAISCSAGKLRTVGILHRQLVQVWHL